jgi:hypothetical protein
MCLIKGAFVGEKNFDVIEMHGTTIEKNVKSNYVKLYNYCIKLYKCLESNKLIPSQVHE